MIPILATLWIATDAARELASDVQSALDRAGITRKGFCHYTGLTEQQACDQFALRQPLNLWRLAQLPGLFLEKFAEVLAERHDKIQLDRKLVKLFVIVEAQPRPMLRCELPANRKSEVA